MRYIKIGSLFLILMIVSIGCSISENGLEKLKGQVYWEDGGVLPAGSRVTIQINNSSLADDSEILTQTSYTVEGQQPINFFLEYDASLVDDRMNYSAFIRIDDPDGKLLYVTMTNQPVIIRGDQVEDIRILVEPI